MNNGTAVGLRPSMAPQRIGQATAIEQSRAVAEVQAAVVMARQFPRNVQAAIEEMKDACSQIELARDAFFEYPRAKETVSGPTVHLARELARCWGNIQYGITELSRDDYRGESEMKAWAWDLQTNATSSNTFIVPHKRDTKTGVRELTDMRDIYENNANNGARRVREAIFALLPVWFRSRAEQLCQETLENGGGVPLAERIAEAVAAFERLRVTPAQIAAKFNRPTVDALTAAHVAKLGVIYTSIKQGTVTVADEFPEEAGRISAADLAPQNASPAAEAADATRSAAAGTPSGSPVQETAAAGEALPEPGSPAYKRAMNAAQAQLKRFCAGDTEEELAESKRVLAARVLRSETVVPLHDLTVAELRDVSNTLGECRDAEALEALLGSGEVRHGE